MNLWQATIEALESLSSNKLRSGLTMLGIVIGVGAVIAMLAVGRGAQDTITGSISGLGSNLLFVFGGNMTEDVRIEQPLTQSDAEALADPFQAPSIEAVAPTISSSRTVTYGGEQTSAQINGVTPDYFQVRNYGLLEGEPINEGHQLGRASVVVLGPEVADKLFGRRDGVTGETVRIQGQPFRVLGVLEPKGGSSFGSQDNIALVPFSTAQARLIQRSRGRVDMILVQAVSAEVVPQASDEISQILRARHRTEIGADDFTIFTQQDFVETAQVITNVLTIFLGGVAAISLLVGGIGIMNIMLVSVTERTREIGLRQAVGATPGDIQVQFLAEALMLSLMGGLIGVLAGVGGGWLFGALSDMRTVIAPYSLLLSFTSAALIGVFFGFFPARKAAQLDPIEALRHE